MLCGSSGGIECPSSVLITLTGIFAIFFLSGVLPRKTEMGSEGQSVNERRVQRYLSCDRQRKTAFFQKATQQRQVYSNRPPHRTANE
jgi:hypothetical protein